MIKYSVILPTYNREDTLRKTLASLVTQDDIPSSEYEILVVDDGSTDNTKSVTAEYKNSSSGPTVTYIYQTNSGPSKARNVGIKNARGTILFFTDDDCVVPLNWMKELLAGYERHPDVVGVGGYHEAHSSLPTSYFQRYLDYTVTQANHMYAYGEIKTNSFEFDVGRLGTTSNMTYRKKILVEMEGFDENLVVPAEEDHELKKRILADGHALLYIPSLVKHLKVYTFKLFFKKFFNQGYGRYYMSLKFCSLKKNPSYRMGVGSFLFGQIAYVFSGKKFHVAHFIKNLSGLLAQLYGQYVKHPPQVTHVEVNNQVSRFIIKKKN